MYKFVGIGALALIIGLGIYFDWPRDGNATPMVAQQQIVPPELSQITAYLNSPATTQNPITLASLHGKVVLLHFWRFACSECQKNMPFVNTLYTTYAPFGLVILGIHSPQYGYEGDINQVKNAITQYGVKYPVLLDNNKATWNEYGDSYWPKDVMIGKSGYMRYTHVGTGDEATIQQQIRTLLAER